MDAHLLPDDDGVVVCLWQGDVVAVSVGEGLKMIVACVECGPASNAPAFIAACKRAREGAPAESPDLTQAYNTWLISRMRVSGMMAGAGPLPAEMERKAWPASAGGKTKPFIKSVGPLPMELGIEMNNWQRNRVNALGGIEIEKANAYLHKPHASSFVDQLNAGDKVLSLHGVGITGVADHAWLNSVKAAAPRSQYPYMDVLTTMPYFQPTHLVTVTVGSLAELGLEGGPAKPPKLGPSGVPALGLLPADVVVQANVGGEGSHGSGAPTRHCAHMCALFSLLWHVLLSVCVVQVGGTQLDATGMTSDQLLTAMQAAPGPFMLTVLQPSRVGACSHTHSWPMAH